MSAYIQCPECGKRALKIATRCPQCGHEFSSAEPDADRPVEPRRSLAIPAAAVAALIALVAVGWWARRTPPERAQGTAVIVPDRVVEPDTAFVPDSAKTALSVERMFARTWTNVRTGRSIGTDVAAVLLPGDTVLVDSLQRGWWRVTFEGKVVGYVHRSTVQTEPPK
jgi:rubredoxin